MEISPKSRSKNSKVCQIMLSGVVGLALGVAGAVIYQKPKVFTYEKCEKGEAWGKHCDEEVKDQSDISGKK